MPKFTTANKITANKKKSNSSKGLSIVTNLVGRGTTSCRLSQEHLIINNVDVSLKAMEAREIFVKKEATLKKADELLTLNFIFSKSILKSLVSDQVLGEIFGTRKVTRIPEEHCSFLKGCTRTAGTQDYQHFQDKLSKAPNAVRNSLTFKVIQNMTCTDRIWGTKKGQSLNEATYQHFFVTPVIETLLHGLGATIAIDSRLEEMPSLDASLEEFRPDIIARVDDFPVLLVEVKKPGIKAGKLLSFDYLKLLSMMKLSLNKMVWGNINNPVVVGVLVQSTAMRFYMMELRSEALYIPKEVGRMHLPTDRSTFSRMCGGLGILEDVQPLVQRVAEAVRGRQASPPGPSPQEPQDLKYTRPSYFIRRRE